MDGGSSTKRARGDRFSLLTRDEKHFVMWGVFFTFAPIGILIQMILKTPGTWPAGVIGALISGAISVGWAWTFMSRRWWMIAVLVVFPFIGPPQIYMLASRAGLLTPAEGWSDVWRRLVLAVMALLCMIAGYLLVVAVSRQQEKRSTQMRTELDMAAKIHQSLVPEVSVRAGAIEVLGTSVPSSSMGGDLIDAVVRGGSVDALLADVSGHGVGAGIVMGMVKSSARTLLRGTPSVATLLTDLNVVLSELTRPEMFATMAIIRVRPDGWAEYGLAGHLPIYHYRLASGYVAELPNEHLPLGVEAEEAFRSGEVAVGPGDTLIVFTDGLMEVRNAAGRELGLAAIREVVRANSAGPLPALRDAILAVARAHGPQTDDQSVLLVRLRGD